jgi:hypothetical protein
MAIFPVLGVVYYFAQLRPTLEQCERRLAAGRERHDAGLRPREVPIGPGGRRELKVLHESVRSASTPFLLKRREQNVTTLKVLGTAASELMRAGKAPDTVVGEAIVVTYELQWTYQELLRRHRHEDVGFDPSVLAMGDIEMKRMRDEDLARYWQSREAGDLSSAPLATEAEVSEAVALAAARSRRNGEARAFIRGPEPPTRGRSLERPSGERSY